MRSVCGGLPAIAQTHASHTCELAGDRTRFCPVKFAPIHSPTETPRDEGDAHT